jgi:hypothetical protein
LSRSVVIGGASRLSLRSLSVMLAPMVMASDRTSEPDDDDDSDKDEAAGDGGASGGQKSHQGSFAGAPTIKPRVENAEIAFAKPYQASTLSVIFCSRHFFYSIEYLIIHLPTLIALQLDPFFCDVRFLFSTRTDVDGAGEDRHASRRCARCRPQRIGGGGQQQRRRRRRS